MKNEVFMEGIDSSRLKRLDLIAFIGAFLAGLILYVTLHRALDLPQWIVTTAIVGVMVAYGLLAVSVPRLRVRLDQAGDNAYYLGLLFTLMSMAFALGEFGVAIVSENGLVPGRTGAQQLIANFGIALASTVAGIFLRVILHQMRVDPADVEGMTRIELSEASKRVRSSLDTVTNDLGLFHNEVRQRSTDVVTTLLEDAKKTVSSINQELDRTTKEMLASVGNAHKGVMDQTQELTRLIGGTASEAMGAIERLRGVEPPPLTLSRRLDKVTKALESAGDQTERIASYLQGTADSAATTMEETSKAATTLSQIAQQMKDSNTGVTQTIAASVERVSAALDSVGQRLEQDRQLLVQLEEQSRRSIEESVRAQAAALEVLTRLTELTRGLTAALKEEKAGDDRGKA